MASIEQLKEMICLHEVADKLDMKKHSKGKNGNAVYFSPSREEKNASLSVFAKGKGWKDHATGAGGSCIDLVIEAGRADNVHEAAEWLHHEFNIVKDKVARVERSQEEWLAEQCLKRATDCSGYLFDERKIIKEVIEYGINSKSLGYSDYTSSKPAGEKFHGGPAVAFICKDFASRRVNCLEYRYFDAALNGGVKNHCHGSKGPAFWSINHGNLKAAHTVVLVESPINALSVESAVYECDELKGWTALAVLGAANVSEKNWSLLQGKRVVVAMDNDKPIKEGHKQGYCAGDLAAWAIHETLTGLNIVSHFADHSRWGELNDLNDILKDKGVETLRRAIKNFEPWLIPGLSGNGGDNKPATQGKPRLFLPEHDYAKYWQFRVKEDFTTFQKEVTDKEGESHLVNEDLCGFRVAALSRVKIQSANATMSGEKDNQPNVVFAGSVQSARHGNRLVRQVFTDEQLYNPEKWRSFGGAIYKPAQFSRMLNIMERATHIGGREALNFVGLAFKDGKPVLNEGPDCYFTEPEKQCPYHNLQFPSGPVSDAAVVMNAYQKTFGQNAAMMALAWIMGGHLKTYLGFWPHMVMQADKGAGKSTLIKRLERTTGFTMFSGQSLQTEFRLVTAVSHTSHPVGWEEISARRQDVIDKAVALLQETYQYTINRRGSEMTEFVLSAPVLLSGEDVPVKSLLGKVVRTELQHRGDMLPDNLPVFPVREWLKFLAGVGRGRVMEIYNDCRDYCMIKCSSTVEDNGAARMLGNYAALATAWNLLCEFAGMHRNTGDFGIDLVRTMNQHILETSADREPWVWIMEIILGEIDAGNYDRPFKFERTGDDVLLFVRTAHLMQYLSQTASLRPKYDALPVKSDRVLKKQMDKAGVILSEFDDKERRIGGKRVAHMCGLSLKKLEEFGLSPVLPEDIPDHL